MDAPNLPAETAEQRAFRESEDAKFEAFAEFHLKHAAENTAAERERDLAPVVRLIREEVVPALTARSGKEVAGAEADKTPSAPVTLATIDEVLSSMPAPGERLATGFPTLDRCSRGGFARGRVYTFIGPPGKGKTAMLCQLSRIFATRGAAVLAFFHDEGAWQAGLMMAEGLDFDRDALENNYGGTRAAVQEKTALLKIRLAPPEATLGDAETWLSASGNEAIEKIAGLYGGTAKGGPATACVVAIDSVQKVRASKSAAPQTRKEQADSVMTAARKHAARGAIVLVASKANRASWSNKNPSDNIDPLAAGLDSSSIEYESDALFFMAGDPAERSFLKVTKNRPGDGTTPTIALHYDRDRATFSEIDKAAAEEAREEADREHQAAKWSKDEARVLKLIREHPKRSGNMLRQLLKINKARLGALLEELERKGTIVNREGWCIKAEENES